MRNLRRALFVIALLVIVGCATLLITNYDPSNPTHRRYSSRNVKSTGEAPSDEIGRDGEDVLEADLGLTRNDAIIPVQVFCNIKYKDAPPPAKNTECIYFSNTIENYRVPDFLSDDIVAESKNSERLLVTQERNFKQIQAFAEASIALKRPLWIYVRHNTLVDDEYHQLAESTGGRVVKYFVTTNYVNPLDYQLMQIITGALVIIIVLLGTKVVEGYFRFALPNPYKPRSSVGIPQHKASRTAQNSFNDYEQFMRNAGDHARNLLDK